MSVQSHSKKLESLPLWSRCCACFSLSHCVASLRLANSQVRSRCLLVPQSSFVVHADEMNEPRMTVKNSFRMSCWVFLMHHQQLQRSRLPGQHRAMTSFLPFPPLFLLSLDAGPPSSVSGSVCELQVYLGWPLTPPSSPLPFSSPRWCAEWLSYQSFSEQVVTLSSLLVSFAAVIFRHSDLVSLFGSSLVNVPTWVLPCLVIPPQFGYTWIL